MFCCGINSYKDFKQYMKNYSQLLNKQEIKPALILHTHEDTTEEICNEWENIPTPRCQ